MKPDHEAALAWAKQFPKNAMPDNNLATCYRELRELAKAAYDSRILGHTDEEEALHAAIGEE